jgi:tetratricopeptide (TPR) repeat protein
VSDISTTRLLEVAEEALVEAGFCTGDFATANESARAARAQAVSDGDRGLEAAASCRLGMVMHYANITRRMAGHEVLDADVDDEEGLFRHALSVTEDLKDLAGTAQSLFGLGLVHQVIRGDSASAMPLLWRALEICESRGDEVDLYTRSEVHRHVGFYYGVEEVDTAQAVSYLQRSLELREELGDPRLLPSGLDALAEAEVDAGNPRRAIELLEQSILIGRQAGLLPSRVQATQAVLAKATAAIAALE